MNISTIEASTLCDDLAIESTDSNLGTIEEWGSNIDTPADVTSSDARNLCYALRLDDGSNVEIIIEWSSTLSGSATVLADPAAAEVAPSSDPAAPSSASASSSGSSDSAPAVDPAAPVA